MAHSRDGRRRPVSLSFLHYRIGGAPPREAQEVVGMTPALGWPSWGSGRVAPAGTAAPGAALTPPAGK